MGYRSHVIICVRGHKDKIFNGLAALRLEGISLEHLNKYVQIPIGEEGIVLKFEGDQVKWYPDYEDVRALERVYSYFSELPDSAADGHDLSGAFARIGEDDDDTETRYFGEEGFTLVNVRRSIECEYHVP